MAEKWKQICQVNKVQETEKAICFDFPQGAAGKEHLVWIPKSCYREQVICDGMIIKQEVKSWFFNKNLRGL